MPFLKESVAPMFHGMTFSFQVISRRLLVVAFRPGLMVGVTNPWFCSYDFFIHSIHTLFVNGNILR